jgi:hypothetical protein
MKENNFELSSPELKLKFELEKLVEDNCILRSPDLQLTIEFDKH